MKKLVAAALGTFVLAGGISAWVTTSASSSDSVPKVEPTTYIPKSGVTADGRTFGPLPDDPKAEVPDLVSIRGTSGKFGFAEYDLVFAGPPADMGPGSPGYEEYLASQPTSFPVYAEDGVTEIDTFTLSKPIRFDGEGNEIPQD